MKSKAEVISSVLKGKRVIDIGGSGYNKGQRYESHIAAAWKVAEKRLIVDMSQYADIHWNLNMFPLPEIPDADSFDYATAFDILEHLERPIDVLRWIPVKELLVSLPNVFSPIARHLESKTPGHLYNFTKLTATNMLSKGNWRIDKYYYTFGKWSPLARLINLAGSLCPMRVATGVMIHCTRIEG